MSFKESLANTLITLLGKLPLSLARSLGAGLGKLAFTIKDRNSRTTLANIQACYPKLTDNEQQALAKSSMVETGKLAFELPLIWSADGPSLKALIHSIEGKSYVEDAINKKKGLIVIAPHLGNWEVLGRYLSSIVPITSMYQPPKQQFLEHFIKSARENDGATLVPTNTRGVAKILKALKNGETTGILPDQVPEDESGIFSTFYGLPTYTMTLIHGLIKRTNCSVVIAYAKRTERGFEIIFRSPLVEIYSHNIDESTLAMNQSIEKLIEENPNQYQWEYKRFKKKDANGKAPILYQ